DRPPRSAAFWTRDCELQMPLDACRLARAATWRACHFARTMRLPRAIARGARMQAGDADFRVYAPNRFFKTDRDRVFDFLPSLRMAQPVPPACDVSEDFTEVRSDRSRKIESLKAESPTRS